MAKVQHTCTGCVPIDASIIDVYVTLVETNKSVTNAEAGRTEAEAARVVAETQRTATFATDHNRAVADHSIALSDHATAGSDHTSTVAATNAANAAAAVANAKAELVQARLDTADADHTRAEGDHSKAVTDHSTASSDHTTAQSDHTTAGADHTRAETDHSTAASDHTASGMATAAATAAATLATEKAGLVQDKLDRADTDHTRAESDHTTAVSDHGIAGTDHTTATGDHATASADHTLAGADHTTAAADHTQAASDHTLAAADHTTAGADHTQALADHEVMEGYDTRLTNTETEVSQLGQEVDEFEDGFAVVGKNNFDPTTMLVQSGKYASINSSGKVIFNTAADMNAYKVPVVSGQKYSFNNAIRFVVPAIDDIDATASSPLQNISSIDLANYPGTKFLFISVNINKVPPANLVVVNGESVEYRETLPRWSNEVYKEIEQEINGTSIDLTSIRRFAIGKFIKSGRISSSDNFFYTIPINLRKGQTVEVITLGYGFDVISNYSSGNYTTLVPAVSSAPETAQTYSYTALTDTQVVVCAKDSAGLSIRTYMSGVLPQVEGVVTMVETLNAEINEFKDGFNIEGVNIFEPATMLYATGKYVSLSDGQIVLVTNANINTYKIPVIPGSKYVFSAQMRFAIAAADDITPTSDLLSYITGIDLSNYPGTNYLLISINPTTVPPSSLVVARGTTAVYNVTIPGWCKDAIARANGGTSFRDSFALAQNETKSLPINYVRKSSRTVVSIGAFTSIRFGLGYNKYIGYWVEIDSTTVRVFYHWYNGTDIQVTSYSHGLNISGGIIAAVVSDKTTASIIITDSFGAVSKTDDIPWVGAGAAFITNLGNSDVSGEIAFFPGDVNEKVWMFGDSYMGIDNRERWPYYLLSWGIDKWLSSAYPGINSVSSKPCFDNLVTIGRPRFLLWGLGMNDASDTDATTPDATWLSNVQSVISYCEANGITPILATIPTAKNNDDSLLKYNEGKNYWVRNSGYRYIDFALAVGANADGTWTTGLKASDIHPSEFGAKVLASRVLIDFPEIMVS